MKRPTRGLMTVTRFGRESGCELGPEWAVDVVVLAGFIPKELDVWPHPTQDLCSSRIALRLPAAHRTSCQPCYRDMRWPRYRAQAVVQANDSLVGGNVDENTVEPATAKVRGFTDVLGCRRSWR